MSLTQRAARAGHDERLSKMKTLVAGFIFCFLTAHPCMAGGSSFEAQIVTLTAIGGEEYKMVLVQFSSPYYGSDVMKPKRLLIHLRHDSSPFGKPLPDYISREKYLEAISSLKEQARKGGRFPFGIMAAGFHPVEGKENEFQSNSLAILEEHQGRKVVYSFEKL